MHGAALPILKEVEEGEADLVEKRPRLHVPGLETVGVDALINIPLLAQRLGDLEASGNKTVLVMKIRDSGHDEKVLHMICMENVGCRI